MIKPVFIVAFSGHRPNQSAGRTERELEACALRLRQVFEALRERASKFGGELHLVVSLAAGSDVIACETAISLGIPIHLVIPKPEAAFLETYRHADASKDLSHWLPRACAILATVRPDVSLPLIPVNPHHTIRIGAVSTTSPACYAEVNTKLLESADLLLTLSNGEPSASIAGTTHLIGQARAIGIPCLNLNPAESPQSPLPEIPADFIHPDCPTLISFASIRPHLCCDESSGVSPFHSLAKCLSKAADDSSRIFRRSSAIAITCHTVATILAATVASYYYVLKKPSNGMTDSQVLWLFAIVAFIESILVGGGWYLERRLHKDKKQRIWLDCRFARELMRSMEKSHPFIDPLYPDIQRHLPAWKRFTLTSGLMLRLQQPIPLNPTSEQIELWKNDYLKSRLQSQLDHFTRKHQESTKPQRFFTWLTHKSAVAALIFVLIALVFKTHDLFADQPFSKKHYYWSAFLLLFLPILMPLLATVGASFGAVFDYGRRSTRYREMIDSLSLAARVLPNLHTLPDITQLVRQTEEALQDENIEWLSAQKKGLGH